MGNYYIDPYKYDDIIHVSWPLAKGRMPQKDRASIFMPFKALTGYDEAVEETARVTTERITLDETTVENLNRKLQEISEHLKERRTFAITYFVADARKSGGAYLTDIGTVKKIDIIEKIILMDNGVRIPMENIIGIEEEN